MSSSYPNIASTETENSYYSAEFKNNINITPSSANSLIKQMRYINNGKLRKLSLSSNGLHQDGESNRFYKFTKYVPCILSINENTVDGHIIGLNTNNKAIITANNNTHYINLADNICINDGNMYGGDILSITSAEPPQTSSHRSNTSNNSATSIHTPQISSNNSVTSIYTPLTSSNNSVTSIYTPLTSSNTIKSSIFKNPHRTSTNTSNYVSSSAPVNKTTSYQTDETTSFNSIPILTKNTSQSTSFNSSMTEPESSGRSIHGMRGGKRAGFLNMDSNSVNSYFSESSSAPEYGLCD